MRSVQIWSAGAETDRQRFDRDQAMLCAVAVDGRPMIRVHHGAGAGLALGRYHRMDPQADSVARRLTGGRALATGPDLNEITLVVPSSGWLDPESAPLTPERVLNRALRPLLGVLREAGVDAFYPGRDLITVGGRAVACAAFTVLPDGLLIVEQIVGWREALAATGDRLAELDPGGIAAVDAGAFEESVSLAGLLGARWADSDLARALGAAAERCWRCAADVGVGPPQAVEAVQGPSDGAYAAFRRERGPLRPGRSNAVDLTMLGTVEVAASIEEGCLREVEISGDLIAPHATLEAICRELDGVRPTAALARRVLTPVLADPRHFVLGAPDLAALVGRLA